MAFWSQGATGDSGSGGAEARPLIYAVDDMPCLTELYGLVLSKLGYAVKGFHDRQVAVTSLRAAKIKPALLITDLHNPTMRIGPFLDQCIEVCPGLRILLVSGFGYHQGWCFSVKADPFLAEPLTPVGLRHAGGASLPGVAPECSA